MIPDFRIVVDGHQVVTAAIRERLLGLRVSDEAGHRSDTVEIRLDNRGGLVKPPRRGAVLQVELGYSAGGELAGVFHCPHTSADGCRCRKPLPGLLEQIQAAVGLPVAGEYMVGDSMTDLEAASAAGARPALVRTGFGTATERQLPSGHAVPVFDDLAEFTGWLLRPAE